MEQQEHVYTYTAEIDAALDVARDAAAGGMPVFIAPPHVHREVHDEYYCKLGCEKEFDLPTGWEKTRANSAIIDRWKPGDALCLVQGVVSDTIDTDIDRGGAPSRALIQDHMPRIFGLADTPSGGTHEIIAPLNIGKHTRLGDLAGLDLQGGRSDGTGLTFIYASPTMRPSKVTGEIKMYTWVQPPDMAALAEGDADMSAVLADRIAQLIDHQKAKAAAEWKAPNGLKFKTLPDAYSGPIPYGARDPRMFQYASHLRARSVPIEVAERLMLTRLMDCEQPDNKPKATEKWAKEKLEAVYRRYPAGAKPRRRTAAAAATPGPTEALEHGNDTFNADALIALHGDKIRFVSNIGWFTWSGVRWQFDAANASVRELFKEMAKDLPTSSKSDIKERHYALSASGTTNALRQAQSDHRVLIDADDLDADPYLLNTPDGIVDLETGALGRHDPADLQTKITAVGVEPGGPHPMWDDFLNVTFDGKSDMIHFIQQLCGLSLIGEPVEQILPFSIGSGWNGKSVLADLLQKVLGVGESGYAAAMAPGFLSEGPDKHPTEIARLRGVRLAMCSEQEGGKKFAEARVKLLTGGDTLSAHFMRHDDFNFQPSHLLWVVGNQLPSVAVGGPSFWRRVKPIAFSHVVPKSQRIPLFDDLLIEAEGPAILDWMIAGATDVRLNGLQIPKEVQAAADQYEEDEDPLRFWVEEELTVTGIKTDELSNGTLWRNYSKWMALNQPDAEPISSKALQSRLDGYNLGRRRDMHTRYRTGVILATSPSQGVNDAMTNDGIFQ